MILFGKFGKANMNSLLSNKNILVTGGAGLVGSHLVEELLKINAKVYVLDIVILPKSYFDSQKFKDRVVYLNIDLADFKAVKNAILEYNIEYIFHLGAQALVLEAYLNPLRTFESNIMGTANVLESVRGNSKVKAVVVASSDKAYGKNCIDALEDWPLMGDHPYDVSKSATDLIATSYFKTYNLPVAVSRFGNIFGPGDLYFDRIIPGIMESVITGKTLEIRSDGEFKRDYVYVKDVVSGYIALAENIDKIKGEAFNFSSGINLSVLSIVKEVENILGKKIEYKILNNQKNEIPAQSLNFDKAKRLLNWKPQADFKQSILETFEWYKKYFLNV